MTWRDKCRPVVARVLRDNVKGDERALRRALRDAYPFGARNWWPYRVWLDEIKVQRGLRPPRRGNPAPVPGQLAIPGLEVSANGKR
jgi:hypothetical protein